MFQDPNQSSKLQRIGLASLVDKIRYKAEWYDRVFVQISRWFPSSKNCHKCRYYNKNLKRDEREWTCPKCGAHHDRDVNAAKNILMEGLRIYHENLVNLRDWGDSTVILEALASTAREVRILIWIFSSNIKNKKMAMVGSFSELFHIDIVYLYF